MKKYKFVLLLLLVISLSNCKMHELSMPYRNMVYDGSILFPIKESDSHKAFRVWINNGSSINRVITIYCDSIISPLGLDPTYTKNEECQGNIMENGFKRGGIFKKEKKILTENFIEPKSGFKGFFNKIDSLGFQRYSSQDPNSFGIPVDSPFSLYVIEIKNNTEYNSFKFYTDFPTSQETDQSNKYKMAEKFIFKEFGLNFEKGN